MSVSFADVGVPVRICAGLAARGIVTPSAIQAAALPDVLAGRDVCGRAPTGSGKTIAFGLAIALRTGQARPRHPRSLVLVPTRELAAQVQVELSALVGPKRSVLAIYGGTSYVPQRRALRKGVDIVVACPGRLEDLLAQGDLSLSDVELVVLDEADRMADMGFLPAVRRLLDATRPDRQTLLFSATLDGEVDAVTRRYQRDPVRHDVTPEPEDSGDVEHHFWRVERSQRVGVTAKAVADLGRSLIFCRTRHGADRLSKQLAAAGLQTAVIHGSRTQAQRDRALAAFVAGRANALVATDVAARGIHVDDVAGVIHFDPVDDPKDYVHRSGRTGRAGATGTVISLVGDDQAKAIGSLKRTLGIDVRLTEPGSLEGGVRLPINGPSAEAQQSTKVQPGDGRRRQHAPRSRSAFDSRGATDSRGGDQAQPSRGRPQPRGKAGAARTAASRNRRPQRSS